MTVEARIGIGVVLCVHYTDNVISHLCVQPVLGGPSLLQTRAQFLKRLDAGEQFHTVYVDGEKERVGADVRAVMSSKSERFVTTDPNDTEKDNLGEIPRDDECPHGCERA